MTLRLSAVTFLAALLLGPLARADVVLPAVFSDHMVLQAALAAPVFGQAGPGEQITVELNGQRKHWGQGDFPFLIVQLPNYQERRAEPWEGKDCALREAQLKTLAVPNTALAVTIDLGEGKDPHPPNKRPVGQRLALAARALAYGEKIEYSGPLFKSAQFEGGKVFVSFTHVGGGLIAKDDGKLTGFLLCGRDHKFVRAEAVIEGDKVIVSSDKVAEPIAVRYAWERNPECNLSNKEGLPVSPFRSDDFVNYFTRDGTN